MQWFQNNAHPSKWTEWLIPSCSPKKPHAINGINIFEKKYKEAVTREAANVRDAQGINAQSSIGVYNQVLWDMYQNADPGVKATCEGNVKASNDFCEEKPSASDIYVQVLSFVCCTKKN